MTAMKWMILTGLLIATALTAPWQGLIGRNPAAVRLAAAASWHYQLQSLDLDKLAASDADLMVIDFSQSQGEGRPMRPLTAGDVTRLKRKPDGTPRVVLSYLSIGEAEEYRFYWNAAWKNEQPQWLIAENCRWPRNHLVRFWDDAWKDIMIRGDGSYLARIAAAGFDGVYLDRIDVYDDIKDRHPEARDRMIAFVEELAREARRRHPHFLVVAQNAEDLLDTARYRAVLDGLAKEDLLYGLGGTGTRNGSDDIAWSRTRIDALKKAGKPVFAAEYLNRGELIASARQELARIGYVPAFPPRALDGADPLRVRSADDFGREYGTPEYTSRNCNGVWKKS